MIRGVFDGGNFSSVVNPAFEPAAVKPFYPAPDPVAETNLSPT